MATKKELEEQMEELYQLYDEIRQKVHSLEQEVKTVRENEKNIVDEQIAIKYHLNKNQGELEHELQQGRISLYDYLCIIRGDTEAIKERLDELRSQRDEAKYKGFQRTSPYSKAPKEESECIEIQRGDDKNHKVYLNAGDKVVIDGHEISFKRTDGGQLVCDHTAYNPTSEFTVSEEPDYLQVGDQWRDGEGNEYVLSKFPILGEYYATLVNKETGDTANYGVKMHDTKNNVLKPSDYNGCDPSNTLGITDSMVKIK